MEYKCFEGKFTGISNLKGLLFNIGKYNFREFNWDYIKIDSLQLIENYDVEKEKIGDFYYTEKIAARKSKLNPFYWKTAQPKVNFKRDFFWIESISLGLPKLKRRSEVFIPITEQHHFNTDLFEVIIRDITLDPNSELLYKKDFIEIQGTIRFKIKIPTIPAEVTKTVKESEGVNQSDAIITNTVDQNSTNPTIATIPSSSNAPTATSPPLFTNILPSYSKNWFLVFLGALFWIFLISFVSLYYSSLYKFAIFSSIGWLVSRFVAVNFFKKTFNFLFFLFICLFIYALVSNQLTLSDPTVEKKDGNVKIEPPKAVKKHGENSNNTDYLIGKNIRWYDFITNAYQLQYNTSVESFFETQKAHAAADQNFMSTSQDPVSYYHKLYKKLDELDNTKVDSIVKLLGKKAKAKKLNSLQTAEMVVTFIQEIPYVLVHQSSCKEIIKNEQGSSFLADYHADGKPCLPNIPGGVQSPYEFLHNLKGDCDTRSLLGYTILRKLNIAASVWISQAYGHSILGVGLPVGNGSYKTINGSKHYGVELTNKGFRLGMISPQQRDMSNWDIALYSNNFN
jgi:hypothetical protein